MQRWCGRAVRVWVASGFAAATSDEGPRITRPFFWDTNAKRPLRARCSERAFGIIGRRRRTLPPGGPGSTIRAAGFHFRVRDGIGWIPRAIATGHKVDQGVGLGSEALALRDDQLSAFRERMCVAHVDQSNGPVKPHGPLVRLGCSAHAPCTCRLSTWSSPTALKGAQGPREDSSLEGLPT